MNGNDKRFMAELKSFVIGSSVLESAGEPALQAGGRALRFGAKKSFADYVGLKVSEWVQSQFR